jgi:hypothetical protein
MGQLTMRGMKWAVMVIDLPSIKHENTGGENVSLVYIAIGDSRRKIEGMCLSTGSREREQRWTSDIQGHVECAENLVRVRYASAYILVRGYECESGESLTGLHIPSSHYTSHSQRRGLT